MKTRVVVLLASPGGYCNVYYGSRAEAHEAIAAWRDRQSARFKEGRLNEVDTYLFESRDPNDQSVVGAAILGQFIIGMYIPDDKPTAADRMAAAIERQAGDGEDWKTL